MKIALRITGILYLLLGVFFISMFSRVLSLYSEFGASVPFYTYLILFVIPLFGAFQVLITFIKNFPKKILKIVFVIALVLIVMSLVLGSLSFVLPIYNINSQI